MESNELLFNMVLIIKTNILPVPESVEDGNLAYNFRINEEEEKILKTLLPLLKL